MKFTLFTILLIGTATECMAQNTSDKSEAAVISPYNKGVELFKAGQFELAKSQFDSAIALKEWDADAYYNRGVINYRMKNTKDACRDWSLAAYYNDTAAYDLINKYCDSLVIVDDDTSKIMISTENQIAHRYLMSKNKDERVYSTADAMPQFPGGDMELIKYIQGNTHYPDIARMKKISGKVFVSFTITKEGKVYRPYVLKGIGAGCDEEAVRVIKSMPDWIPGTQKGKRIQVLFTVPVNFML